MKITIIDTAAYLDTPYNPEFVSQIKNIGGARWDSSRREWKIPAACVEQAREIMRRVFGECESARRNPPGKRQADFQRERLRQYPRITYHLW